MVLDAISEASSRFASKHKRPAVFFLDNVTELAKHDAASFQLLVKFAKEEADKKNLVVNFVASEGHTPQLLSGLSEKSRLSQVMEIGDLDWDQARKFLARFDYSEPQMKDIYDIAGGRITLLQEVHNRIKRGQDLNRMYSNLTILNSLIRY
eukprot:TRINITY_DN452_c0_g1_i2.p2 TRINITY_DN452_c0_g1~~TRINITY_DN452_c0_g1_i2.p2  ORF type:complete len:151 (+),score=19.43 TRINITY_DN452_c0_g1_i2:641-1093(+)